MAKAEIVISMSKCGNCGRQLENGKLLYRTEKQGYCSYCMDMERYNWSKSAKIYRFARYYVKNGTAHLIIDDWGYWLLTDGVYSLSKCEEFDIVDEIKHSEMTANQFAEFVNQSVLEISNKALHQHAAIIYPPAEKISVSSVVKEARTLEAREIFFKMLTGSKKLYYILDECENIIGMTNSDMANKNYWGLKFEFHRICSKDNLLIICEKRNYENVSTSDKETEEKLPIAAPLPSSDKKLKDDENITIDYPTVFAVRAALETLRPDVMLKYCEQRIHGQGAQLKKAVYQVYVYLQKIAKGERFSANNWMLTAPSGSGKTEFYRSIRDLFELYKIPVPVVQIDLSQITESGYKGDNVNTIPQRVLDEGPRKGGIGICFLDEADKKFVPSYSSHGCDTNAAIQSNLLTLVEGSRMKVEHKDTRKDYDSGLTMFVLMGAFQNLRGKRSTRKTSKPIGFGVDISQTEDTSDSSADEFYSDISIEDMIAYGMQEELAGRMTQVVNFHRLSREDMREVLRCKAKEISDEIEVDIELSDEAEDELLDMSFGSMGIRRPMNVIKELAQNAVAEVFFEGEFNSTRQRVVIDSASEAHVSRSRKSRWSKR